MSSLTTPFRPSDIPTGLVGIATHADRMYFNPQLVQVEHA